MIDKSKVVDFLLEYEEFMPEHIHRKLKIDIKSDFAVSIIGPRRAGKTYFMHQLRRGLDDVMYLNFEDSRIRDTKYSELRDIIRIYIELFGRTPRYLFLDEIQVMDGWEIILRELHELKKYKVVITGSSSRLLSKEIATQMRGRTLSYWLLPFDFSEFLTSKGHKTKKAVTKDEEARVRNVLKEYLEYGGFPDISFSSDKIRILREYADLILYRDFIERHNIKNPALARFILEYMLQNFSNEITANSIYKKAKSIELKTAKDTVYDYLDRLEDTAFFFFLERYSARAHMRKAFPKKVYLCDTGLTKIVRFSGDYGKLMENTVFLELMRETNENPLINIYYYKGSQNHEVDFLLKEGNKITRLIQVCYDLDDSGTKRRELRSLVKASKELKCSSLLVVTWDYEGEEEFKGKKIKFVPLWKWLLGYGY